MNLNVSPMDLISSDDGDQCHKPFGLNNQVISSLSSSSVACHTFFNQTDRDQIGYCHHRLYQPQYQQDDTYASQGGSGSGSSCEMKNTVENYGFKLSLESEKNIKYPVKWMSSKMRLMQKMKNPDRFPLKITSTSNIDVTTNLEDHNLHPISSSFEIDLSNNNSSYNSSSCPVRVCSDCNTTKTPLWRSGPKGPKSLCNACGIRQRKVRRALAAAAAVSTVVSSTTDQPSAMKIKVQQKEKTTVKNGNVTQLKKRYKMAAAAAGGGGGGGGGGSPSNVRQKKLGFEDFLINLSENLKFHRVFPEDERDAAILLMALSSGLVHG